VEGFDPPSLCHRWFLCHEVTVFDEMRVWINSVYVVVILLGNYYNLR
jgi:hypothetical protein